MQILRQYCPSINLNLSTHTGYISAHTQTQPEPRSFGGQTHFSRFTICPVVVLRNEKRARNEHNAEHRRFDGIASERERGVDPTNDQNEEEQMDCGRNESYGPVRQIGHHHDNYVVGVPK